MVQCYSICFVKDEIVDYHIKHGKFPADQLVLPKRVWPDVVVLTWTLLLAIPMAVAVVYLAYTGAWLILGLIILTFFLSKFAGISYKRTFLDAIAGSL